MKDRKGYRRRSRLDRVLGLFALVMFVCGGALLVWTYVPWITLPGDTPAAGAASAAEQAAGQIETSSSPEAVGSPLVIGADEADAGAALSPPGEQPPQPPEASEAARQADPEQIAAEFAGEPLPAADLSDAPPTESASEGSASEGSGQVKGPAAHKLSGTEVGMRGGVPVDDASTTVTPGRDGSGPSDKTMKLSVPKMERVKDLTVHNTAGDDLEALADSAIHLQSTGFPWQQEANIYIAGHRLGYRGTDSHMVFWDIDDLKNGDAIYVEDSAGKEYEYRVYKTEVVDPGDTSAAAVVPGKNILTLQSCTLPDYSERLLVRAEKVEPSGGQAQTEDS